MCRDSIIISGIYVSTDNEGLGIYVEVPRVDGKTAWRRVYKGLPPCKCPTDGTLIRPVFVRKMEECDPFDGEEAPVEKEYR